MTKNKKRFSTKAVIVLTVLFVVLIIIVIGIEWYIVSAQFQPITQTPNITVCNRSLLCDEVPGWENITVIKSWGCKEVLVC